MKKTYPKYKRGQLKEKKILKLNLDIMDKFLKECSMTAKESKLNKIKSILIQIVDITQKDLDKLTREDVVDFVGLLNNSGRTDWTTNEIKVYLKKFLLWQYKDLEMVKGIKQKSKENAFNDKRINEATLFTEQEVNKLIRSAETLRMKAWILLAFETGARPEEITNLKWKNIAFGDEDITDVTLYSNKTGKTRVFPVKRTSVHLKRWRQEFSYPDVNNEDYVFPSPRNRDKPMHQTSFRDRLKVLAKKAGIEKPVFSYLFRHTRATKLYEELPQQIAEKLLGHKNMAQIYAHISNKKAKRSMLDKIYNIKELSPEKKAELEKKIEQQRIEFKNLLKSLVILDKDGNVNPNVEVRVMKER